MKELLDQIVTFFAHADSGPLTSAFTGGIHEGVAPPGTAMPYLVYDVISNSNAARYGGISFEEPEIQFRSFGVGSAAALGNLETFIARFDEKQFTLATGQNLFSLRTAGPVPAPGNEEPDGDEQQRPCYAWMTSYRYASTK